MRPQSITLVAIWYWIRGAIWAFFGLGIFLFAKVIGGLLESMPDWVSTVWHTLGIGFAAVLILLAILDFAIGGGLLSLKKWAANLAIGLSAIHVLLGLGSVFGHMHLLAMIPFSLNVATVIYLLLPGIRARFR